MKAPQFYITSVLGALCLILAISTLVLGQKHKDLEKIQTQQQEELKKGSLVIQVAQNMLRDMAEASLRNPKIKDVLAKNGITVNVAPSPSPANHSTPQSTPAQ